MRGRYDLTQTEINKKQEILKKIGIPSSDLIEAFKELSKPSKEELGLIKKETEIINELIQEEGSKKIFHTILNKDSLLLKQSMSKDKIGANAWKISSSNPQWESIYRLVEYSPNGRIREKDKMLDIVRAILYKEGTGCRWKELPQWMLPETTVRHYYYEWKNNRILDKIKNTISNNLENKENNNNNVKFLEVY